MRATALVLLVLVAACGGSSGNSGPALIANTALRIADVVLDTVQSPAGTIIHGPGVGLGGGPQCGTIMEVNGYRTATAVVFRIEDANGFCFDTDLYEIVLGNVEWRGKRGALLFANDGHPTLSNAGAAYFVPTGALAFRVPEIVVFQAIDSQVASRLILSIPIDQFRFTQVDGDDQSIFQVSAQIERFTQPAFVADFTDPVDVDLIDVFPVP